MRTVRCSSRLLGGVCPGGSARGGGGVFQHALRQSPLGVYPSMHWGRPLPPVDRILDTRLWKHYLSATSFADGKNTDWNSCQICQICQYCIICENLYWVGYIIWSYVFLLFVHTICHSSQILYYVWFFVSLLRNCCSIIYVRIDFCLNYLCICGCKQSVKLTTYVLLCYYLTPTEWQR